jgi:hypothetical protein
MLASAGLLALSTWRASKPATPLKVRLIPWRPIILLAACVLIFLGVHLFTVLGLKQDMTVPL